MEPSHLWNLYKCWRYLCKPLLVLSVAQAGKKEGGGFEEEEAIIRAEDHIIKKACKSRALRKVCNR